MNHKQKNKIEFFLGGLEEKYNAAKDYFIRIDLRLISGRKEYKGKITRSGDNLILSFAGTKIFDNFKNLSSSLVETAIQYDKVEIEYIERGITTVIIADDKNVRLEKKENKEIVPVEPRLKDKEYNISLYKAKDLLFTLGYTTEDGKLKNDKIRKYNQTDRFIELIKPLFSNEKNLTIVDCACGKSYLSFVLNYWLWQEKRIKAKFIGLDISEKVIEESKKTAEKLGYSNMEFFQKDLSLLENSELEKNINPDIVISLHACDTATDMALGYAIRKKAKSVICVPCCHKEMLESLKNPDIDALTQNHGIMRERFNSIMTDCIRMLKLESKGYDVSCVEYCSPLDTPKNLLIKAIKVRERNPEKEKAYYDTLKNFHVSPSIEIYSD